VKLALREIAGLVITRAWTRIDIGAAYRWRRLAGHAERIPRPPHRFLPLEGMPAHQLGMPVLDTERPCLWALQIWLGSRETAGGSVLAPSGLRDAARQAVNTGDEESCAAVLARVKNYDRNRFGGEPPAEGEKSPADKPILSGAAAAAYEILLEQPPYRGLTGPELLLAMDERGCPTDQSSLTSRIIPELRPYGVENVPRKGYRIPTGRRPKPE